MVPSACSRPWGNTLSNDEPNKPFLWLLLSSVLLRYWGSQVDNIFMKGNWDQVRRVIWSFVSLFLPEIHSPHRQGYIRVFSHLHSSPRNSFKMCFRRMDAFLLNTTSFKDLILHLYYKTHPDDSPGWGGEEGAWSFPRLFPSSTGPQRLHARNREMKTFQHRVYLRYIG